MLFKGQLYERKMKVCVGVEDAIEKRSLGLTSEGK